MKIRLFLLLILIGATRSPLAAQGVKLTFTANANTRPAQVGISGFDFPLQRVYLYDSATAVAGAGSFRFGLEAPAYLSLLGYEFFVQPGDDVALRLQVDWSGKKIKSVEGARGNNANNYIFSFELAQAFAKRRFAVPTHDQFTDLLAFKGQRFDVYRKKLAVIDSLRGVIPISETYYDRLTRDEYYAYLVSLSRPFFRYRVNRHTAPRSYYEEFLEVDFQDESQIASPSFSTALWAYHYFILGDVDVKPFSYAHFQDRYKTAVENFDGRMEEFLLKNLVVYYAGHADMAFDERFVLAYEEILSGMEDPAFRAIVASHNYFGKPQQKAIPDELLDASFVSFDGERVPLRRILHGVAGKAAYVDLWASWCAPCKAEFRHAEALQAELAKSGSELLYLSIDKDAGKWRKDVVKYGQDKGSSFVATDEARALLEKHLGVHEIPRYVLLDTQHRIAYPDAPRPSELDRLGVLLNKLNPGVHVEPAPPLALPPAVDQ